MTEPTTPGNRLEPYRTTSGFGMDDVAAARAMDTTTTTTASSRMENDVKRNDGGADQIPATKTKETHKASSGGLKGWLKRHIGPGDDSHSEPDQIQGRKSGEIMDGIAGLKGHSHAIGVKGSKGGIGVEDSSTGMIVGDPAPAGDVLARDGGKGDGVIR